MRKFCISDESTGLVRLAGVTWVTLAPDRNLNRFSMTDGSISTVTSVDSPQNDPSVVLVGFQCRVLTLRTFFKAGVGGGGGGGGIGGGGGGGHVVGRLVTRVISGSEFKLEDSPVSPVAFVFIAMVEKLCLIRKVAWDCVNGHRGLD